MSSYPYLQFYFRITYGAKTWWFFTQLKKNSADCFLLEVTGHCEKKNKILYIANEEERTTTADSQ